MVAPGVAQDPVGVLGDGVVDAVADEHHDVVAVREVLTKHDGKHNNNTNTNTNVPVLKQKPTVRHVG